MHSTTQQAESSIWVENPAISSHCPQCGLLVKHSIDENDQPLFLSVPYRIITIKIFAGGRSFEKVAERYLHRCATKAEPSADGFGHSVGSELALL